MKTFKRTSLPDQICYNNKVYQMDAELSVLYSIGKATKIPQDAIKLEVLSRNLKRKSNLYGKPYEPTIFIFTNCKSGVSCPYLRE